MPGSVSLSQFVAAIQFGDAAATYLDKESGHIISGPQPQEAPHAAAQTSESPPPVSGARFEPLPVLTQEREIEFARQFAQSLASAENRRRVELALSSADPSEGFEAAVFRCRIANEWFRYRDERLLQFAKEWLDTQGVSYIDDMSAPGE